MTKLQLISGILSICVSLPIWFYILYQVLEAIEATELTWFLFWAYWPVTVLSAVVFSITKINDQADR